MIFELGIALALVCAIATNVSFLCRHRGACAAPTVDIRRPLRSAINLYRSRWFALGMAVAVGAWLCHVGALAFAPISLVQAVLAGGLVLVAVIAERYFGLSLDRRQWLAILVMGVGLVLLTLLSPTPHGAHSAFVMAAMLAFECGLLFGGAMLALVAKLAATKYRGVLLGTAAGSLFTVSDIAIKALSGTVANAGVLGLLSPWLAACVVASVLAFYTSAHSLQQGDGVSVIAATAAASNITAMAGGIVIFGDPLAGGPIGLVGESLAFALIVIAAAVIPAPVRLGMSNSPESARA